VGREKVFKHVGEKSNRTVSTTDTHFTVLGFTSGNGEPIMCAVIFAANEITLQMQQVLFVVLQRGITFNLLKQMLQPQLIPKKRR